MSAVAEMKKLKAAGFADEEIGVWARDTRIQMADAGFRQDEIDTYFGHPPFDPQPLVDHFNTALEQATQPASAEGQPAPVTDFMDALKAGWGEGVVSLLHEKPKTAVAHDAPMASRIAGQIGTMAGDFPAMVAGYLAGAGQITGTAGAFAFPAAMRRVLMEKYQKGEVQNFQDFWERASATFIDAAKGYMTGAATGAVGKAVGLTPIVSPTAKAAAVGGSEIATMVTVGKALEGQVPEPQEFLDAAVTLGFVKGASKTAGKLREIYAQTGVRPREIIKDAQKDPTIAQDLAAADVAIPRAYEPASAEPQAQMNDAQFTSNISLGDKYVSKHVSHQNVRHVDLGDAASMQKEIVRDTLTDGTPIKFTQDGKREIAAWVPSRSYLGGKPAPDQERPWLEKSWLDAENTWDKIGTVKLESDGALEHIVVSEKYRRHGLATRLVEMATERMGAKPFQAKDVSDSGAAFLNSLREKQSTYKSETPAPEKKIATSEAESVILDRIVREDPKTKGMSWREFYTATIDNLHPIWGDLKDIGKENLPTAENPYDLQRLTRGVMGKGAQFFERGAFDFNTYETVTRGYTQIIEPVKKDLDRLSAYMVAKRVVEKEAQGVPTGFDLAKAKEVVAEGTAKFQAIHEELLKFREARLQYLVDSGVVSKDSVKAMREANKDYVPFQRFFEDEPGGKSASTHTVKNPVKRMTGSERKIFDPIMSDIKDTFLFIGLAERNAARQAFVRHPELATKQPAGIRPIALTGKEVESLGGQASEEVATIFRGFTKPLAKDEMVVFEDGKRQVYKVDPAVAEAFQDLDKISTNIVTEMLLHTPANLLRAGVIVTPEYISRNIIRDAVTAFVYTGTHPIKTIKGGISILKKDDAYQKWLKGGGGNATMVALDRDYIHNHIMDLNLETGVFQRAWNVARAPIDVLRAISEFVENSTRLGAVRSELQQAKDKATIQALSMIARESTVDFARHGKSLQEFGKMTAFFNPSLQGIDRFVRATQDNLLATTAKAMASVTLPALYLWWANKDDKEIQDLPRWQRDTMLIARVPLPEGGSFLLRIPLAHELGVLFATLPTRLLDAYVKDNPDAMRDFDKTLMTAFTPSIIPTMPAAIVQQFSNTNTLSGGPLIPSYAEKLLPEYQQTPYTTELTKAIGGMIGAFPGMEHESLRKNAPLSGGIARALTSPILIENYIRQWTGGMGMYLLQLADKGLREAKVLPDPVKPASTLADIPGIRAFIARYPSASAQPIQDFFEDADIIKIKYDTAMELAKSGDPRATSFISRHKADMIKLDGFVNALNIQSRLVRMLDKNPNQTPEEKRQIIDTLYYRMIELSRAGNQFIREVKTTVKAAERAQAPSLRADLPAPAPAPSLSAPMRQAPVPNRAAPPSIGP